MALVDNAIKFSPAGASVEMRTMLEREMIRVAVEDQGIGIRGNPCRASLTVSITSTGAETNSSMASAWDLPSPGR